VRASPWLLVVFVLAACLSGLGACLGLGLALAPQRVDLFHAALFDVCTLNTYAWHWQSGERLPTTLRFDFITSPDSVMVLEIWLRDGPTLSFSQRLPHAC
jgi:hypothetical protein